MRDPIPPGHGEPDETPATTGRGSNTYTDEEWDDFGRWMAEQEPEPRITSWDPSRREERAA